ncbi:peptidoglycan-binding protein [Streptomyces stramineus]
MKIHYEGVEVSRTLLDDHSACLREWKAIRVSHLANKAENYSDVAYNYAACPHGYLLEGRGIGKRTGANGSQTLNKGHYAIIGLLGSEGLTKPTDAMLHAIRDGIELLRQHGAGSEIKGHRDGYATSCPGGPLYAWVQEGAPRPGGGTLPPGYEPFPGAGFFRTGRTSPIITAMGQRLVAEGCSHYSVGPGPSWTEADRLSYAAWQRKLGYTGADADGYPGPTSWAKLRVPNV